MLIPTTATLLALAATLATTALAIPTNTTLNRAHKPSVAHTVTYCATPAICNTLPIPHLGGACVTLDAGYQLLTFSPGIECNLYLQGWCSKKPFVHAGKRGHVSGAFDAATDVWALKYGVGSVRSFECFKQ
ncbi:hypothetical protein LTR08_006324 [Meristemomyces frigidus]|nr:hypothetical protein LTR08_006324 [Meristemomyces frigidus]